MKHCVNCSFSGWLSSTDEYDTTLPTSRPSHGSVARVCNPATWYWITMKCGNFDPIVAGSILARSCRGVCDVDLSSRSDRWSYMLRVAPCWALLQGPTYIRVQCQRYRSCSCSPTVHSAERMWKHTGGINEELRVSSEASGEESLDSLP